MELRTGMTTIEVMPELDLLDFTGSGSAHECCCRQDAFYCGAPYHPESDASLMNLEPDCDICLAEESAMLCYNGPTPHDHCPIDGTICPFTPDGRRVVE